MKTVGDTFNNQLIVAALMVYSFLFVKNAVTNVAIYLNKGAFKWKQLINKCLLICKWMDFGPYNLRLFCQM